MRFPVYCTVPEVLDPFPVSISKKTKGHSKLIQPILIPTVGQAYAKPNALKGVGKSLYNNATYNIMYALMDWVVSPH